MPDQDTNNRSQGASRNRAFDAWNDDDAAVAPIAVAPPVVGRGIDTPSFASAGVALPAAATATAANPAATAARPAPVASEETMLQVAITPLMGTVGVFLLLTGLGEVAWQIRAPEFGNLQWRFVAIGMLAPNVVVLAIGGVFLTAAAMRTSKPIWGWLWTIASVLLGVSILALLPLFVLDTIQIRPILPSSMSGRFLLLSVAKNVFAYAGAAVVCLMCALTTRRAMRVEQERAAATLKAWSA